MKITRQMHELCEAVGAKLKRVDSQVYLHYDAHGSCAVDDESDFLDSLAAYKGGHRDYAQAIADYYGPWGEG